MRTKIDIDEKLMAEAMSAAGTSTKKDTVNAALELLVRIRQGQTAILALRGKIEWEGDLDAMRRADALVDTWIDPGDMRSAHQQRIEPSTTNSSIAGAWSFDLARPKYQEAGLVPHRRPPYSSGVGEDSLKLALKKPVSDFLEHAAHADRDEASSNWDTDDLEAMRRAE